MSEKSLLKSHKLFSVLGTFTVKEVRRFRLFFQSEYFNTNPAVSAFLDACLHFYPAFAVSKQEIFSLYYVSGPYDDLRFRHLSSDSLKVALAFLAYRQAEQDIDARQAFLLRELCDRKLDQAFGKMWQEEKDKTAAEKWSEETLFRAFQLEKQMGEWVEAQRNRSLDPNISGISGSLDVYFLLQKIRLLCMSASFTTVSSQTADIAMQEEVLGFIRKNYDALPALVRMYYLAYHTLSEPETEEYYQRLQSELQQHLAEAGEKEARELIIIARNYGIRKVNQGDNRYFNELFMLYRMELDANLALVDGQMNPFAFKNIVATALQLKETAWAEEFLEAYRGHLPKRQQEQVYLFNLCRILFVRREYKKARQTLLQHTFRDLFNYLDARVLLIKIHYETGDNESLDSTCEAFRNYLQRNPSLAYHRKHYLNFVRYVQKLSAAEPGTRPEKVYREIADCDTLIDKNWLLEKASGK